MTDLRPWALWLALAAVVLATGLTAGAGLLVEPPPIEERIAELQATTPPEGVDADDLADLDSDDFADDVADPPGLGITALVVVNGLLLVVVGLAALPLLVGNKTTGTVQGVVSLIAGLVGMIGGILLAIAAFALLMVMLGLLLSPPFGTLAYLAVYGFFDTGTALTVLGFVLLLQVAAGVLLVVAHPRFLQHKGLVFLVLTAILLTVVTAFLHGLVPGILVSVTDAVAAIVSAVVGVIWSVAMLIGGIVSVVKLVLATAHARQRETTRT